MKKALKKLAAMVLAAAMCVSMGATGFAQEQAGSYMRTLERDNYSVIVEQETEELPDGTTVVTTLREWRPKNGARNKAGSVTGTVTKEHLTNNVVQGTASLTATFGYNKDIKYVDYSNAYSDFDPSHYFDSDVISDSSTSTTKTVSLTYHYGNRANAKATISIKGTTDGRLTYKK